MLEVPLILGFLLIPVALLVMAIPVVVERQAAAREAAGEVARLLATAETQQLSLHEVEVLLERTEAGHGLSPGSLRLHDDPSGSMEPGGTVTVTVSVDVAVPLVPIIGTVSVGRWVVARSERVPDYGSWQ